MDKERASTTNITKNKNIFFSFFVDSFQFMYYHNLSTRVDDTR